MGVVESNQTRYRGQRQFVVEVNRYVYLVPFVDLGEGEVFLKTIIPSRNRPRQYLGKRRLTMARLDKEEQEILDSVERGEWKPAKLTQTERERYIQMARNTLRKDKRINIRVSRSDLEGLQTQAVQEGIPCQTLVSSILHKYVTGQLIFRKAS